MSILDTLFSFQGRLGRLRWWVALLFQNVVGFATIGFLMAQGGADGLGRANSKALLAFAILFVILYTWSGLAVNTKRWHDRNKSGWWALVNLIPMIGPIWAVVELGFLGPVDVGNRFGPPPGSFDGSDDGFDADRALANWKANAGAGSTGGRADFASRYETTTPVVSRTSDTSWPPRGSGGAARSNPQGGFGRRGL